MFNSPQQVVVVGSSFAGLTAALELRKHLDERHRIVVLDRRSDFTFIPSPVWLPFGKRRSEDITFPLAPVYERKGIEFRNTAATGFDLESRIVHTDDGRPARKNAVTSSLGRGAPGAKARRRQRRAAVGACCPAFVLTACRVRCGPR